MPRFSFAMKQGDMSLTDQDGEEFADLAAAEQHGRLVAYELGRNKTRAALRDCSVVICNEAGTQLSEILLIDVNEDSADLPSSQRRVH